MKKIDGLLVKVFLPPLLLSTGLVMFILTMQSFWKYIDDVIGKGASVYTVVEFLILLSVVLVPLALPAAILLSTLIVMGNLSEYYEMTAMKSAGLSLWRIMAPFIIICLGVSFFSFVCSNNIVPIANLKFRTQLYNFKNQKLALSLEEDVFNDDFRNFSIRIGEKNEDTGEIGDLMLYDHSAENRTRARIILAETAEMDTETDSRYLIMKMKDGKQYQEMEEDRTRKKDEPKRYPYMRLSFEKMEKYLNLKEFEARETDEEFFKNNESMMSFRQLFWELDTMRAKSEEKRMDLVNLSNNYFHFIKTSDSTQFYAPMAEVGERDLSEADKKNARDVLKGKGRDMSKAQNKHSDVSKKRPTPRKSVRPTPNKRNEPEKLIERIVKGNPSSFDAIFEAKHKEQMYGRAIATAKNILQKSEDVVTKIKRQDTKIGNYVYEIHFKLSMAVACMIFLFIGAPLGAIIRKGGFGYPIIIGVLLFVIFITLISVCKKLAQNGDLPHPGLGAWLPVLIFFIPCVFLTVGAVRDAKMMNLDLLTQKVQRFFMGRKNNPKA